MSGIPGLMRGLRAPEAIGGRRRMDGETVDAERRLPGCRGGRLCVVTLCATC